MSEKISEIKSRNIEIVDIDSIVQNPKNANKHPVEQIKRLEKLIKYQGFRNPLIISNRTGFLVVGHGRLEAAKNLGMQQVPVIFQDFENEAQEYSYLISDNEIARWASLDKELMLDSISEIEELDVELLGIEDFKLFDFEEASEVDSEKEDSTSKFILKVELPSEMDMHDLKDELLSKGYNVKVEGDR